MLLQQTDIRIAAEDAKFGFTEIKLGIGGAGGAFLANELPYAIMMEMCMTDDAIDAQGACRWGLVNKVVPASD